MVSGSHPRYVAIWGSDSAVGEAVTRLAERDFAGVLAVDCEGQWTEKTRESVIENPDTSQAASGNGPSNGSEPILSAAQWISRHWGRLDALIDCSSGMELWPMSDDTPERLLRVLEANVVDPWRHTNELVEFLALGHEPAVVYLSSVDGLLGNPSLPAYSARPGRDRIIGSNYGGTVREPWHSC